MSNLARLCWSRIDTDLPPGVHLPKKHGDVGYDLEAMKDVVIPPMAARDVPVNAEIQLPPNIWATIRNRSSMGRRDLYVDQNVIDNGYRGPIFILIRNMKMPWSQTRRIPSGRDPHAITIKAGERIGQLVFHQMTMVNLHEVAEIDKNTERAATGFGSTGM